EPEVIKMLTWPDASSIMRCQVVSEQLHDEPRGFRTASVSPDADAGLSVLLSLCPADAVQLVPGEARFRRGRRCSRGGGYPQRLGVGVQGGPRPGERATARAA